MGFCQGWVEMLQGKNKNAPQHDIISSFQKISKHWLSAKIEIDLAAPLRFCNEFSIESSNFHHGRSSWVNTIGVNSELFGCCIGIMLGLKSLHTPYGTIIFLQSNANILLNKIIFTNSFSFIVLCNHLLWFSCYWESQQSAQRNHQHRSLECRDVNSSNCREPL